MKFSLLKQKLINYHQNKGWAKKLDIFSARTQIVLLESYISTLENNPSISDDSNIFYNDFLNHVAQQNNQQSLFSDNYMQSGCLSANLFCDWQKLDSIPIPLIVNIPFLPVSFNISPIRGPDYSTILASNSDFIRSYQSIFPERENSLRRRDIITPLWPIGTMVYDFVGQDAQNTRLKNANNYHLETLLLLGQEVLYRIKLVNGLQLKMDELKPVYFEIGRTLINYLRLNIIEIPEGTLFSIKLLIEKKISKKSGYSTLFPKNILKIQPAHALEYISEHLQTYYLLPTIILLHVAEQINPTGIKDVRDYLADEFAKENANVTKIIQMIIRRLNTADLKMHQAKSNINGPAI